MKTIIETERLILRPLTLADVETAYYGWTGDPEVAEYVSWLSQSFCVNNLRKCHPEA
jgi:RimJ/RimL family protein N-acetyltransferase